MTREDWWRTLFVVLSCPVLALVGGAAEMLLDHYFGPVIASFLPASMLALGFMLVRENWHRHHVPPREQPPDITRPRPPSQAA